MYLYDAHSTKQLNIGVQLWNQTTQDPSTLHICPYTLFIYYSPRSEIIFYMFKCAWKVIIYVVLCQGENKKNILILGNDDK